MKKYTIIAASLGSVVALALAMTASAQVIATSSTIHARLEARYGTSTPPGMHTGMSSTTRMENQQKRVTAIQGRSDTEITARIDSLNKLLSRLGSMKNIPSSDEASLASSIQTEIANLTSLKGSIDADTSTSTLVTDYQSITKSYRVYALVLPQASITAAADRVLDLVNAFNALATKLQAYVTTAQNNGTNVSAAVSALADLTAKTTDASTQANAAISEVSGLQPDQGATSTLQANTGALKDAQSKIKAATTDLAAARKDVTTVVNVIKGSMKLPGSSSSYSSSTTAH